MRLANRVQKLERARPPSLLEPLQRALDDSSFRLTGRDLNSILGDEAAVDRVIDDVHCSFTQKLSESGLASLIPELERISSGAPGVPQESATA
jgi:hypothetical protein